LRANDVASKRGLTPRERLNWLKRITTEFDGSKNAILDGAAVIGRAQFGPDIA
jgi:hypothetical protein